MTSYNFKLLDLADGESGDAAVSVVVGKKKAAAAKLAAAEPAATQEKAKSFSYYTKLKHDSGVRICRQDQNRLRDSLVKLRGLQTELRAIPGNEYKSRLMQLRDEELKLRQEQRKLWEEEWTLVQQRNAFYNEYGIPLPEEPDNNFHGANADPSSNYNGVSDSDVGSSGYSDYGGDNDQYQTYLSDGGSSGYSYYGGNNDQYQTHLCDSGEHYPHGHDKRQIGRGYDHYNNDDRHLGEIEPADIDRHIREIEPVDVDEHIADHSIADAGIQDWVHIDISRPNSVTDAVGVQDWVYIDISAPNNHANGAYCGTK